MWIFLNNGFFSIVESSDDHNKFMVRARVKGDLEEIFGHDQTVFTTPENDYRYRMILNKSYVSEVIKQKLQSIDYYNFKASIPTADYSRKAAYSKVWSVMYDLQERQI